MNYILHILVMCEIYIILSLAMNLLAGYTGLLSLSQAAFYGTGAYVSALLIKRTDLGFLMSLFVAISFNLVMCLPVIWFSIRLKNLFFSLATLAWQIIVFSILFNWVSVTNGPFGITGIPRPTLLQLRFNTISSFALLGAGITIITMFLFYIFHRSPLSRLIQAVREDELALMTFGKTPNRYKALAIFISGGTSAVAGCLFAVYTGYIDPTVFTLDESILIVSIVLIGGLGSLKGSVAGALFYILLPEVLRFIRIPDTLAANVRMMLYALILILIVLYRPYGFFGKQKV